jgi:nitrate/nitrite transport system substrate-binding protein
VAVLLAGAQGINPIKDVKTITVPPPQMVANMRVGNMDGFCVGEPWNNRAIMDNIGFTAATSQDIWTDHPEKVLGTTAEWVQQNPNTARAMVGHPRSRQVDRRLASANKQKTAETIAGRSPTSIPTPTSSSPACSAATRTAWARAGTTRTT